MISHPWHTQSTSRENKDFPFGKRKQINRWIWCECMECNDGMNILKFYVRLFILLLFVLNSRSAFVGYRKKTVCKVKLNVNDIVNNLDYSSSEVSNWHSFIWSKSTLVFYMLQLQCSSVYVHTKVYTFHLLSVWSFNGANSSEPTICLNIRMNRIHIVRLVR